jgi:ubiquinone/menaquinone biosynthesis C-methylase UbiE
MIPQLQNRYLIPEMMDSPDLDPAEHQRALAGLRRVNQISRTSSVIAAAIEAIAHRFQMRSMTILDVGCGSGDVAIGISRQLNSRLHCLVTGVDMSPLAIDVARRNLPNSLDVRFEVADVHDMVRSDDTDHLSFDVVYCSLFLHHFSNVDSVAMLKTFRRLCTKAVLIDDLCRTRLGWLMARIGCHLLSRSPIVHFDGPQSVRAAYSIAEMRSLAEQSEMNNAFIRKHWPERFLFQWEKTS